MSDLRSKYKKKTAKISDLKKKQEAENALIGARGFSDYLEFEDGKTCKFRLLPAKDQEFYILRRQCWITVEDDDGDEVRRTVPHSVLHGGTEKDIIDEYIKFVNANVSDKEKIKILKDWKNGLSFDNEWLAYAVKIKGEKREFGLLPFKKTVRDAVNKEMFVEDEDDPIEIDPFTDIDKGLPILVKYNSKPNKKRNEDYYVVKLGKKAVPVTDEELEKLDKAKSLEELFRNNYSISDFELALEGLRLFDESNEIDIFENDEWLEIIEEVRGQYEPADEDEEEDEDEKPKKSSRKSTKKSSKVEEDEDEEDESDDEDEDDDQDDDGDEDEEDEEDGDEFDDMDRKELRIHIKKNKLDIVVKKSMSDDDIREEIRNYEESDEDDEDEDDEDDVEETPKKGKSSIADIRARLAAKSKKK